MAPEPGPWITLHNGPYSSDDNTENLLCQAPVPGTIGGTDEEWQESPRQREHQVQRQGLRKVTACLRNEDALGRQRGELRDEEEQGRLLSQETGVSQGKCRLLTGLLDEAGEADTQAPGGSWQLR